MTTLKVGIKINKLDAARRQLRTAITLWFNNGDPVSIHALVYAAHEIIHYVSKKKNPERPTLLFDSQRVKPEYRDQFNLFLKKNANFFKHGKLDVDGIIEFHPVLNDLFLLTSIAGVSACGESPDEESAAFLLWMQIHKPDWFSDGDGNRIVDRFPVNQLTDIRSLPKDQFLATYKLAKARGYC